jgi:tRNA A37 threonylcarbamoyladenosine dehydratase/Tat protein secretion system quality control protein TatD with DNase activity
MRLIARARARVDRPTRARTRRKARSSAPTRGGRAEARSEGARADSDAAACRVKFAFEGTARLYGDARYERLRAAHVLVVGLGGVGSWAVEALARTGVGRLTLIDLDAVCETNVNRQAEATVETIGAFKADAMMDRVRAINPDCDVRVVRDFVQRENVEEILGGAAREVGGGVDYVLDAIDKEKDKAAIIAYCVSERIRICSTGGAGGVDSLSELRAEDLANVTFNRLLSSTRKTLRKRYAFPKESGDGGSFPGANKGKRKSQGKWGVKCVYAPENDNTFKKAGTKGRGGIGCEGVGGSAVFVTGAIGFKAASEIVIDLVQDSMADGNSSNKQPSTATTGWRSRVWPPNDTSDTADDSAQTPNEDSQKVIPGRQDELQPTTASLEAARALDSVEMFDAHCHWHLDGERKAIRKLCAKLAGAAMTTTRPGDWGAAQAVREGDDGLNVNVPIALGVHPWWAHLEKEGKDDWMRELRLNIESTPNSVVGEIGLDKVATPPDGSQPDYENQLDCFKRQLALATDVRRPVVVHSVKATGDMMDIFRNSAELPPRIFMHSFGGSEDFMKQLTKMKKFGDRFYYGFSSVINLRSPKTQGVIKAVPDDRLLLEDELRTMLAIIADVKGWTVKEAARVTRENAIRFYSSSV